MVDKGVIVKLMGGREVHGVLKGYDQLLNLVLDDTVEYLRDPDVSAFYAIPYFGGPSQISAVPHISTSSVPSHDSSFFSVPSQPPICINYLLPPCPFLHLCYSTHPHPEMDLHDSPSALLLGISDSPAQATTSPLASLTHVWRMKYRKYRIP